MRHIFLIISIIFFTISCVSSKPKPKLIYLFNGKSFKGWQGDTTNTWRIQNGELVGGSLTQTVPHNEFLSTTQSYTNYKIKLKFKITGIEGVLNAGIQIHSQRIANPAYEMIGYQADIGNGVWGSLYDESRRNKMLATANPAQIKRLLRPNDWNDYEVHTTGGRVQIFLNGEQTVDYTETDPSIPQSGLIALQIHGGGKTEVRYKDVILEKLPNPKKAKRK